MDWYMEKKETGRMKRIIRMTRYQLILPKSQNLQGQ